MEESKENRSQVNRFQVDEMHATNIVEWNKKRKLHSHQLDLLRPKHKCWIGSFSSEHASMFDGNLVLESTHDHIVKSRTDAAFLDDRSKPESAKDSNSFIEDSDTAMSVNEEAKVEADSANTYLFGRLSTSFGCSDDNNGICKGKVYKFKCMNNNTDIVKDDHCSLDVSTVNRVSYSEEETYVDSNCNSSYDDPDTQALKNPEELFLGLESFSGHVYSKYVKDSSDHSVDKEFEDFLFTNGVDPQMYVLSSERWSANQEAQSSTRPPTIDQEFEQYFSTLML